MQLLEVGMQLACQMPLPLFACRYTMGFTWEYPPSSPFCSTLMCMQRGHTKPDSMQTGGVLNGSGCHSCIVCGYNPMYSVPGAQPLCTPTFHMPCPGSTSPAHNRHYRARGCPRSSPSTHSLVVSVMHGGVPARHPPHIIDCRPSTLFFAFLQCYPMLLLSELMMRGFLIGISSKISDSACTHSKSELLLSWSIFRACE